MRRDLPTAHQRLKASEETTAWLAGFNEAGVWDPEVARAALRAAAPANVLYKLGLGCKGNKAAKAAKTTGAATAKAAATVPAVKAAKAPAVKAAKAAVPAPPVAAVTSLSGAAEAVIASAAVSLMTWRDLQANFQGCIKDPPAVAAGLRDLAVAAAALVALPSPPQRGRYVSDSWAEVQYKNSCSLHALKFILGVNIGSEDPLSVVLGMLTAMNSVPSSADGRWRHLPAPGTVPGGRAPWASLLMGVSRPLYRCGVQESLLEKILLALNPPDNSPLAERVYQHYLCNNTAGGFANHEMNSFQKLLNLVRTHGPADGRDPTAVLVLYSPKNMPQSGHCVAYRAPASGGADWRNWILHDAVLGVFKASNAAATGHAMWDAGGSLAFFFLKLPAEDGPARKAAVVNAVRRLGEYMAAMFNSCSLTDLLPAKPLFSAVLDVAAAVPGVAVAVASTGGAATPLPPVPLVPPPPARAASQRPAVAAPAPAVVPRDLPPRARSQRLLASAPGPPPGPGLSGPAVPGGGKRR
jgi:hypothetical protein